jgi:hypothetical protein
MSNRATSNRDLHIARSIEEGKIRVWADGFGVWHADIPLIKGCGHGYSRPLEIARYAIRLMLQERAPRDTYVDPPEVVLVVNDGMRAEYKEAP